jgi:hypothetical protein
MSIDKLSDLSDSTIIEMKRLDSNGKTIDTERNKIYTKKQSNINDNVSAASFDMNIRDKATSSNNNSNNNNNNNSIKKTKIVYDESRNLLDTNYIDLNQINETISSFATNKTFATGLLDIALISTNFQQLKQVILSKKDVPFDTIELVVMFSICLSLILQLICGIFLVFSTRSTDFIDELEMENNVKNNNLITFLILLITILNIFVNVFLNI